MSALQASTRLQVLNATGQAGTAGKSNICKIVLTNSSGAVAWVQMFDLAIASVTIGTTVSAFAVPLAATTGHVEIDFFPGWVVQNQLSIFSTTGDAGASGSSSGVSAQIWVE